MKLYLSSYKLGNQSDELKKWIQSSKNNKIALIDNSKDAYLDEKRKITGIENNTKDLEELGFEVILLDLKKYFGKKELLKSDLQDIYAFYVTGGNTFVLRKAMKLSGFDELLLEYSNNKDYLYAGYSAGICCLCKDMSALSIMDEPFVDPYNTGLPPIYNGIGFIEELIIPHYDSCHKESELASETVKYCKKFKINYQTIRDGEVLIKDTI